VRIAHHDALATTVLVYESGRRRHCRWPRPPERESGQGEHARLEREGAPPTACSCSSSSSRAQRCGHQFGRIGTAHAHVGCVEDCERVPERGSAEGRSRRGWCGWTRAGRDRTGPTAGSRSSCGVGQGGRRGGGGGGVSSSDPKVVGERKEGDGKREGSPRIDGFGRGVDGDELVDGEDGFADWAGATVRDDEPLYPRADQQPVKEGGRFGARTSCMQGQQYK
jgi:hypothetical protein